MNQLAVHQDDADILLKERNILDDSIVSKYETAGQITQSGLNYLIQLINDSYHLSKTDGLLTIQQLCLKTDSFIARLLAQKYKSGVNEKGFAQPTAIDLNELIGGGFSPEIDNEGEYIFKAGDVVTLSLGAQIDGYTSQVSHTIVIYPAGAAPTGPLLGKNADAVCAAHIANETTVALLGLSLSPEKIPEQLSSQFGTAVSGSMIRAVVDFIADNYNCVVLPGSKVRRVRRFLAGQAEGIVAERDFKGVVWSESHQEEKLLSKSSLNKELILSENKSTTTRKSVDNTIPTDEFIVEVGEVYQVDIRMASVADLEAGIITTQDVDQYTGKNEKSEFNSKSTIYIRDVVINHQLKLKTSRKLLYQVDKSMSVYPFKLSHTCKAFPLSDKDTTEAILLEMTKSRIGMSEMHNRHLVKSKPIQITKFVPLQTILLTANPTGAMGIDSTKQVLPGMEVPLPKLGVSQLLLQQIAKSGTNIPNVRESSSVLINNLTNEVLRLSGGVQVCKPSFVHSNYKLKGEFVEAIEQIVKLSKDSRFGITVNECLPYGEKMDLDL